MQFFAVFFILLITDGWIFLLLATFNIIHAYLLFMINDGHGRIIGYINGILTEGADHFAGAAAPAIHTEAAEGGAGAV